MKIRVSAEWAFRRYQAIRDRLPQATFASSSRTVSGLADIAADFDVFVFDSFGVLNVGGTAIPGAAEAVRALRDAGKDVIVLTNGASTPLHGGVAKYAAFGFDFTDNEIVSSRAVLADALDAYDPGMTWAVAAPAKSEIDELPVRVRDLDEQALTAADGFILLDGDDWSDARQLALTEALAARPRPVLVGNPDLVSPWEDGFGQEPGTFAHALWDDLGIEPVFFGKPYGNAFAAVRARFEDTEPARRFLMIGDTLHTDILGGAAAGMATALVTGHGVMRGLDVDACIAEAAIVPDFILPSI